MSTKQIKILNKLSDKIKESIIRDYKAFGEDFKSEKEYIETFFLSSDDLIKHFNKGLSKLLDHLIKNNGKYNHRNLGFGPTEIIEIQKETMYGQIAALLQMNLSDEGNKGIYWVSFVWEYLENINNYQSTYKNYNSSELKNPKKRYLIDDLLIPISLSDSEIKNKFETLKKIIA